MKKMKSVFLLCAFCSYLGAEQEVKENTVQNCEMEHVNLNEIGGFDVYEQVKGFVLLAFSQSPEAPGFTKMFAEPIIKNFVDELEGLEKRKCIQRLYTLGVTSEILYNPSIDVETGEIEAYRQYLEEEYDLEIPTYDVLSIDNAHRTDYAYVLFIANGFACMESMINIDDYEQALNHMNLNSNHSKRMIFTIMKVFPFIALEEASTLLEDKPGKLRSIERISRKLYKNKISIEEAANRINNLFK